MSAVDPTPRKPGRPPRQPDLTQVPADPASEPRNVTVGDVAPRQPEQYVHSTTANHPVIESPIPVVDPVADMRAALATMRDELKAEIRAEMDAEQAEHTKARTQTLPPPEPAATDPSEGTLIHFLADGMTVGTHVYYRGQEIVLPPSTPWLSMSTREQIVTFGQRMFALGPWEGEGFDLSDPRLNESDRAKLVAVEKKRAALLGQYT